MASSEDLNRALSSLTIGRLETLYKELEKIRKHYSHILNYGPENPFKFEIPWPEPMSMEGDRRENFYDFYRRYKDFCFLSGYENYEERRKCAVLRLMIGKAAKIFLSHRRADDDPVTVEHMFDQLKRHMCPETMTELELSKFYAAQPKESECVNDFVHRLRTQLKYCNVDDGTERDIMLKNKLFDCMPTLQALQEEDAVELGSDGHFTNWSLEETIRQLRLKERAEQVTVELDAWHRVQGVDDMPLANQKCQFCGESSNHERRFCAASKVVCGSCNKRGHFTAVCKKILKAEQKKNKTLKRSEPKLPTVDYFIGAVADAPTAEIDFAIDGVRKTLACELHTYSDCNVMGFGQFCALTGDVDPVMDRTNAVIGGVRAIGEKLIRCYCQERTCMLSFFILRSFGGPKPILGSQATNNLQLNGV